MAKIKRGWGIDMLKINMLVINKDFLKSLQSQKEDILDKISQARLKSFTLDRLISDYSLKLAKHCSSNSNANLFLDEQRLYNDQMAAYSQQSREAKTDLLQHEDGLNELVRTIEKIETFLTQYERSPHLILHKTKNDIMQLIEKSNQTQGIQTEADKIALLYIQENIRKIMDTVPLVQYNYSIKEMHFKYSQICKTLFDAMVYLVKEYNEKKLADFFNIHSHIASFMRNMYLPIENGALTTSVLFSKLPSGPVPFIDADELSSREEMQFQNKLAGLGITLSDDTSKGFFSKLIFFGKINDLSDVQRLGRFIGHLKSYGTINYATGILLLDVLQAYDSEDPITSQTAARLMDVVNNESLPRSLHDEFTILVDKVRTKLTQSNFKHGFVSRSTKQADESSRLLRP